MKKIIKLVLFAMPCCVIQAQPIVSSFSPTSAAEGATISITGVNFGQGPVNNAVFFGGVQGQVQSASATTITVKVPASAENKPITILNKTTHLVGISAAPFYPTFGQGSGSTINSASFAPPINITQTGNVNSNNQWQPRSLASGDIDGDGKPELVMVSNATSVSIFKNISIKGSITLNSFAAPVTLAIPNQFGAFDVKLSDIDGNGKIDIVVASQYTVNIGVFVNNTAVGSINSQSFSNIINIQSGDGSTSVALADFDLDGKPDIVAANTNQGDQNSVSVLKNTSVPGSISFSPHIKFATGRGVRGVDVGDLNNDGYQDIITANQDDNTITILINNKVKGTINTASFATGINVAATGGGPFTVKVADLNGDGRPDIIVPGGIYKNNFSSGTFSSNSVSGLLSNDFAGSCLNIADVNGDDKPEVVGAGNNSPLTISQNQVSGTQITINSFGPLVSFEPGFSPVSNIITDFDGDGRQDIAVCNTGFSGLNVSLGIIKNNLGVVEGKQGSGILQPLASYLKMHVYDQANMTAQLFNSDGTLSNVQPLLKWQSNSNNIVVTDNGEILATAIGSATVTVTNSLYDTALIRVDVLPDTVDILPGPANIIFSPVLLNSSVSSQLAMPTFVVTDFGGNIVTDPVTFSFDTAGVGNVQNNIIQIGTKTGLFNLLAFANGNRLLGSLPVFIYNNAVAGMKADTTYKFTVKRTPVAFNKTNVKSKTIVVSVTRIIVPAHAANSFVLPIITQYNDRPDSVVIAKPSIVSVNPDTTLTANKTGSTLITVFFKNQKITYKAYVAFNFAGNWIGKDKNNKTYRLCFSNFSNNIEYEARNVVDNFPSAPGTITGDATYEPFPTVKSHWTNISYLDTTWQLNTSPQIARIYSAGTGLGNPILNAYWSVDEDHFTATDGTFVGGITPNYPPFGTINFTRAGNCGVDSLSKVLEGEGVRTWVYDSDSLFAYKLEDVYGYTTFYKSTKRYVDFADTSNVPNGKFTPVHYGSYTVADNQTITGLYFDTSSVIIGGQVTNRLVDKVEERLAVSYYNDSLIVISSRFIKRTDLSSGSVYYDLDDEPLYIYLHKNINGTLPITLTQFTAKAESDKVLLNWSTATEVNARMFIVQRSLNGRTFTRVGEVAAAGNSNQLRSYAFADRQAMQYSGQLVYYRLLQTDRDGLQKYTEVRSVRIAKGANLLSLQFNPVRGEAVLNYISQRSEKMAIRLTDLTGQLLLVQQATAIQGANQLHLSTANLAQGVYLIEVLTPTDRHVVRMLKE